MGMMQSIMYEASTIDKLIEIRKCLRETITKVVLDHPKSGVDKDLQKCLGQLEQIIIKVLRESAPEIDDGDNGSGPAGGAGV